MLPAALPALAALLLPAPAPAPAVTCGIPADMPGLATLVGGRAEGFDVDLCRAVAAALTGDPARARFKRIDSIDQFLRDPGIDIAFHALTAKPEREAAWGVRFGPVLLIDGQGFAVRAGSGAEPRRVCVEADTAVAGQLAEWIAAGRRALSVMVVESPAKAVAALRAGRCDAWSADVSVLVATLSGPQAAQFRILDTRLSREPLAPIVRHDDARMLALLRLVAGALIEAERGTPDPALDRVAAQWRLRPNWRSGVYRVAPSLAALWQKHFAGDARPRQSRGPSRLVGDGGEIAAPDYSTR